MLSNRPAGSKKAALAEQQALVMSKAKLKRSGAGGFPAPAQGVTKGGAGQVAGVADPGMMRKPAVRLPGLQGSSTSPDQSVSGPGGPAPPGARPGGPPLPPGAEVGPTPAQGGMASGSPGAPPGRPDLMSLLPPKMQAAMAQNGRDPREAIGTRMQNDLMFKQKMIAMQQQGGFPGGPPPGGPPSGPISMPFQPPGPGGAVSSGPMGGPGGSMPQAPGGPPGSDIGPPMQMQGDPGGAIGQGPPGGPTQMQFGPGGPMPPGGMQQGFPGPGQQMQGFGGMDQQKLKQMLPPAMQGMQGGGTTQGFGGNPQGLNLQSIQQQVQGGGPAPGQMQPGGGQGINPYRGMM